MAFRPAVHGRHFEGDKYKFIGRNTQRNTVWKVSGNTYREIYNKLVDMDVITRYDADPEMEYVLDEIGKTYADFENEDGDLDVDALLNAEGILDDDMAYFHIISNENGNAYYQEWIEDEEEEDEEE